MHSNTVCWVRTCQTNTRYTVHVWYATGSSKPQVSTVHMLSARSTCTRAVSWCASLPLQEACPGESVINLPPEQAVQLTVGAVSPGPKNPTGHSEHVPDTQPPYPAPQRLQAVAAVLRGPAVVEPALGQGVHGGFGSSSFPPADQLPLAHSEQESPPNPATQTTAEAAAQNKSCSQPSGFEKRYAITTQDWFCTSVLLVGCYTLRLCRSARQRTRTANLRQVVER